MSVQVNIFLLLFGGLQGFLLLMFLVYKKLYKAGYAFLLLYLGAMLLQLTLKVMSKIWLMDNWSLLYSLSHFLPLVYGPLAYLFVKYLLQRDVFNKKDLLHFFPFLFLAVCLYAADASRSFDWMNQWIHNPNSRYLLLVFSLAIYHWAAYRCWWKYRAAFHLNYPGSAGTQLNWLRQFIVVSSMTGLIVASALYLLYINYPRGHEYRYGFIALTFIIYWFSYSALTKPVVFAAIKGLAKEEPDKKPIIPPLKVYHSPAKYSNSGLNNERLQNIIDSLEAMMTKERLFLQAELTIGDLADRLHCSRHHLSQALNERLRKSYYDYVNLWRVEEAMLLLKSPTGEQLKVAAIAYEAGFNSLSTFNEVFKKHTGKTPSDFRKEKLKELQKQRV